MDRFLFSVKNDTNKFAAALSLQSQAKQPGIIYYGNEIGLKQERTIAGRDHGDLEARRKMEWCPDRQNGEIAQIYRKIWPK